MTEDLVFRVKKVDITRSNYHFTQRIADANNGTVEISQLFLILCHGNAVIHPGEHEAVICHRLDLQIIVE